MVEQLFCKQQVVSSILTVGSKTEADWAGLEVLSKLATFLSQVLSQKLDATAFPILQADQMAL